ncbi:MAG: tetratricopeptide repeat protein [Candidatus Dormibacteria bacterium]
MAPTAPYQRPKEIEVFLLLAFLTLGFSNPQARSDEAQANLQQAIRALQARDYAAAERGFRDVIAIDPQSAPAYCNLGVLYAQTDRLDSAIEALQRASELTPGNPGISLDLGLVYYRKEEFAEAAPYFERVLQVDPGHVQAHYLLGLSDFRLERYAKAVASLEPILDQEQNDLVYMYVLAVSYGKIGRVNEAVRTFDILQGIGADTPMFHLLLGNLFLENDNSDRARGEIQKAIAKDPTLPYAHLILGVAYRRLGLLESAGKEFDIAIAQNPRDPLGYEDRGTIYLLQGTAPASAFEMFSKALVINPNMPDSLAGMAKCYLASDQPSLAVPLLQRAVELEPRSIKMHYLLGRALLKEGKYTDANKELAEAAKLPQAAAQNEAQNNKEPNESSTLPVLAVPSSDFQIQ